MTRTFFGVVSAMAAVSMFLGGCASMAETDGANPGEVKSATGGPMMIWTANVSISSDTPREAVDKISAIAVKHKGYVENQYICEGHSSIDIRVPAEALEAAIKDMEAAGEITSRSIRGEDVTTQHVDLDAKIKNMTATRNKLKDLYTKAANVKEALEVEKELNRVQTELDALQAKIKTLEKKAALASIHANISRPAILGPVPYLFKWLYWGIEKLFVIRK